MPNVAVLSPAISPQAAAFLLRAPTLTGIYRRETIKLINGLVADGSWGIFDSIHFYATQDATNAALNLVSSSFAATLTGAPTFTPGQGYTGLASANNFVNGPAPNTLSKYTQNSAHFSAWVYTGLGSNTAAVIRAGGINYLVPDTSGNATARVNSAGTASGATANSGRGWFAGTRSNSSAQAVFVNGVQVGTDGAVSGAVSSSVPNIPSSTSTYTISILTWGGDITACAPSVYNRFAACMAAVGGTVP